MNIQKSSSNPVQKEINSKTSDSAIIQGELEKLGATSGKEAAIAGLSPFYNLEGKATGLGAKIGSILFMKDVTYNYELKVRDTSQTIVATIINIVQKQGGNILDQKNNENIVALKAGVYAGFWNMNPVILNITITSLDTGELNIVISGLAKEGILYNSHAAEQAVKRLIGQLKLGSVDEALISVNPETINYNINVILTLTAGIISLVGVIIPYFGFMGGISGIVAGIRGRRTQKKKLLLIGVGLSILGLILATISSLTTTS